MTQVILDSAQPIDYTCISPLYWNTI